MQLYTGLLIKLIIQENSNEHNFKIENGTENDAHLWLVHTTRGRDPDGDRERDGHDRKH